VPSPEPPARPRHAPLVGLLAFSSGGVDVVTLMVVGGTFTSVVTGNLIIVGRAIGTSSLSLALHVIIAVAGYVAGVAAGSRLRHTLGRRIERAASRQAPQSPSRRPAESPSRQAAESPSRQAAESPWPWPATLVLAAECALLAAVNIAWIGYDGAPPAAAVYLLLAAAGIALGMQGAAARAIKGNPSTTYMTGALTALVEALAAGGRRTADPSAVVGLLALVAGAACTAVLLQHARLLALLPPLASLVLVVAVKLREHRAERPALAPAPASR
jgi:uncharacterized membrane protein YoaK (UPF0700 family)